MRLAVILIAAAALPLWAQEIKLPMNLDKLTDKARESVVVTLDKSMLQFASKFVDKDEDAQDLKRLVAGLDSIYVRNFEFDNDGEYSAADVDAVRAQLQPPAWGRIVGVRCKHSGENADVYFKNAANGTLGGIVIIAAEPRELTIVSISGTIDPDRLADLGGEFGIPRLEGHGSRRPR